MAFIPSPVTPAIQSVYFTDPSSDEYIFQARKAKTKEWELAQQELADIRSCSLKDLIMTSKHSMARELLSIEFNDLITNKAKELFELCSEKKRLHRIHDVDE